MIDIIPKPKHVSISKGTLRADKFFIENNTAEKQLNLVFQECVEEIIGSEKTNNNCINSHIIFLLDGEILPFSGPKLNEEIELQFYNSNKVRYIVTYYLYLKFISL